MKSLAPPDTRPLDAISCPQFSRYQLVSLAQGGQRTCHAESPALRILTSHPVYLKQHNATDSCFSSGSTECSCRAPSAGA